MKKVTFLPVGISLEFSSSDFDGKLKQVKFPADQCWEPHLPSFTSHECSLKSQTHTCTEESMMQAL